MCYRGQSFEIEVPLEERWIESGDTKSIAAAFHRQHIALYDFADESAEVQIVNLRLVITGATPSPIFPPLPPGEGTPEPERIVPVWYDGTTQKMAVYRREALHHGHRITGPAIIVQEDTTSCIPANFAGTVDGYGNIHLSWTE